MINHIYGRLNILNNLKESLEAGLDGVAVGRNIFQQEGPESMSKKIKEIIFG